MRTNLKYCESEASFIIKTGGSLAGSFFSQREQLLLTQQLRLREDISNMETGIARVLGTDFVGAVRN